MSRDSRREKDEAELRASEADFERRLVEALKACAAGEPGLFDGEISRRGRRDTRPTETREFTVLGEAIRDERTRLGITAEFWAFARLTHYRDMVDGNAPSEAGRARKLLAEIEARGSRDL